MSDVKDLVDIQSLRDDILIIISECKNNIDIIDNVLNDLVDAYKLGKVVFNIPTQLFMYKYKLFCEGILDIDKEKGEKYIKHLGDKKIKKESYILLEIIERIEEEEKISFIVDIFKARVEMKLNDIEYRRMLIYVSQTLYADLEYMRKSIKDDEILVDREELEGLYKGGWLKLAPMGKQYISKDGVICCLYIDLAKKFCEITSRTESFNDY